MNKNKVATELQMRSRKPALACQNPSPAQANPRMCGCGITMRAHRRMKGENRDVHKAPSKG